MNADHKLIYHKALAATCAMFDLSCWKFQVHSYSPTLYRDAEKGLPPDTPQSSLHPTAFVEVDDEVFVLKVLELDLFPFPDDYYKKALLLKGSHVGKCQEEHGSDNEPICQNYRLVQCSDLWPIGTKSASDLVGGLGDKISKSDGDGLHAHRELEEDLSAPNAATVVNALFWLDAGSASSPDLASFDGFLTEDGECPMDISVQFEGHMAQLRASVSALEGFPGVANQVCLSIWSPRLRALEAV